MVRRLMSFLFCLAMLDSLVSPSRINYVPSGNKSLEFYLCKPEGQKELTPGAKLLLDPSVTHRIGLGQFCVLENLINVTISSNSTHDTALVQCSVDTPDSYSVNTSRGFAFNNGINLTLERLQFSQCGGPLSSSFFRNNSLLPVYFGAYQSVGLFFSHTVNLSLTDIMISDYYGFGIALINAFGTTILSRLEIYNCLSSELHVCSQDNHIRGNYSCYGSGLLIYSHDNCTGGNVSCQVPLTAVNEINAITVSESSFHDNVNLLFDFICIINVFQFQPSRLPLVSGAAVSVFMTQSTFATNITIKDSMIADNIGMISGGILSVYVNTPFTSSLSIDNCSITNNTLRNFCVGTALVAYIYFTDDFITRSRNLTSVQNLLDTWTPLTISNSSISFHSESSAKHKSSTVYVTLRSQPLYYVRVVLDSVSFVGNSATFTGICFNANTAYEPAVNVKRLSVVLRDIVAINNTQANGVMSVFTNSSLFVFYRVERVLIEGTNNFNATFENSLGSVIDAFSTDVYLKGNIVFSKNKASKGPAILLRSSSFLIFSENTSVLFERNVAFLDGGAIYSVEEGTEINDCIFQVDSHTKNITALAIRATFVDNLAYVAGNSMYIRPLQHCFQTRFHAFPSQLSDLYLHIFHFPGSENSSQMASVPVTICKCVSLNQSMCGEQFDAQEIYPGDTITVSLVAQDENSASVQSQVNASFSIDTDNSAPLSGWSLQSGQEINTLVNKSYCQSLNFTILSDLTHKQGHLNFAVPGHSSYTYKPIKLKKCPPGFHLREGACVCKPILETVGLQCETVNKSITKRHSAWVGVISTNDIGYSEYCPIGYCSTTNNTLYPNGTVCLNNREGPLCGNCKVGYSAVHGGYQCKVCDNRNLLWLIGNISAGIILVIFLFAFKITLNTGTVGGLVFYANMFVIVNTVSTDYDYLMPFVQLIQFLNMQQGFPSCLYEGMRFYMNIFLHFIYSVYLWFIVILIVLLAHCSSRIARLVMESSVQVLMTLIHLSFAKILLASINTFTYTRINDFNGGHYAVWVYNGSLRYGTGMHIPLLTTASLFTGGVILPYVGLSVGGWMCLRFSFVNKFRPFFDTIYGPYKDKYRYWFGLRLVLLVVIAVLTAILRGSATFYQYLVQLIVLTLFTLFQAYLKPFKKVWANLLDNWCMVNVLNLVFINLYQTYGGKYSDILLLLALIVICATILAVLGYHIMLFVKSFKNCRKCGGNKSTPLGVAMWIPPPMVREDYGSTGSSSSYSKGFRDSILEYINTDDEAVINN